jgi:hypothetical protein
VLAVDLKLLSTSQTDSTSPTSVLDAVAHQWRATATIRGQLWAACAPRGQEAHPNRFQTCRRPSLTPLFSDNNCNWNEGRLKWVNHAD